MDNFRADFHYCENMEKQFESWLNLYCNIVCVLSNKDVFCPQIGTAKT